MIALNGRKYCTVFLKRNSLKELTEIKRDSKVRFSRIL